MPTDRTDDREKLLLLVRSLEEAREDLRLNGPVRSDEVKDALDRLHAEWDLEDAEVELSHEGQRAP